MCESRVTDPFCLLIFRPMSTATTATGSVASSSGSSGSSSGTSSAGGSGAPSMGLSARETKELASALGSPLTNTGMLDFVDVRVADLEQVLYIALQ